MLEIVDLFLSFKFKWDQIVVLKSNFAVNLNLKTDNLYITFV
jgi:hypothetical protein